MDENMYQVVYTVDGARNMKDLEDKLDRLLKKINNEFHKRVIAVTYNTRPDYSALVLCEGKREQK